MADAANMAKLYYERFHECYPYRYLSNQAEEEHIETIEECLRTGIPIKPKYDDDKDY